MKQMTKLIAEWRQEAQELRAISRKYTVTNNILSAHGAAVAARTLEQCAKELYDNTRLDQEMEG